MIKFYFSFFLFILQFALFSQQNLEKQIPKERTYMLFDIYHERYGINMYDRLVIRLMGDSVRMCKGYACSGWIEDYYVDGKLLHKGYYIDGRLKLFKNFFPNGKTEREFKLSDDRRSTMIINYAKGGVKSVINYIGSDPIEWTDYFENGQIEYHELYDKSFEFYSVQTSNFDNGNPESSLELTDKKRLIFSKKEYYKNGRLKTEGELVYNKDMLDYQRNGKWSYFDEEGNLKKEETYIKGELNKTKEF